MASFADEDQIATDEAFARSLQQQEFVSGGVGRMNAPLMGAAAIGPQRPIQQNVAQEVNDIQMQSPRLLGIFGLLWAMELVTSAVILSKTWNLSCDKPLQTWLLVFTARILFTAPIRLYYYIRTTSNRPIASAAIQFEKFLKIVTFVWFIVGQAWLYSSSTCSSTASTLYIYCLVLIIIVYVSLALPLLVLLGLCLCLPCVLILLRFVGDRNAGASDTDINRLPTRSFNSADSMGAVENGDRPSCVVCMNDFENGDELRVLPCKHEFHLQCVDRWLKVKKECPLCRGDISGNPPNPRNGSEQQV